MDERLEKIYLEKLEEIREIITGKRDVPAPETDDEFRKMIEELVIDGSDLTVNEVREIASRIYIRTRSKLGSITDLAGKRGINEIMVNSPDTVFVEDENGVRRSDTHFDSEAQLEEVIRNIAAQVHREINEMHPILDARLKDGSRVNAVYGNITCGSPVLTIRKFNDKRITMEDMIRLGTVTHECAEALKALVSSGYNMLISGGTSSGKTTFLSALTDYIPKEERVVVIEDSRELDIKSLPNIVQMECHNANSQGNGEVSMDMLIRASLRMRPDRIIVGEVRGKEVSMMLQAMNTGHDGSITTSHGNSVQGMLRRLEAMYLMSEEIPLEAIRAQILEGIDVLVHLKRLRSGKRIVAEVSELTGFRDDAYTLNRLFTLEKGSLLHTGAKLRNREKLELNGRTYELQRNTGEKRESGDIHHHKSYHGRDRRALL